MIEYDFDARFWNPITTGSKSGTIRAIRTKPRRHAKPGEDLELWAQVGGKRLQIARKQCLEVQGVFFKGARNQIHLGDITRNRSTWPELDLGAREGLARLTGHADWKEARDCYESRYGEDPVTLALITWCDRDYLGPKPTPQQLRDLRIVVDKGKVIPAYGKISVPVGHALLLLKWCEVVDPASVYWEKAKQGHCAIRATELGRQVLERFEK
jgi:hypothetical protein